jgi:Mce-associated membrane protein
VLRGEARDTYDKLFAQVRELAPDQKLVLTTRVVSTAVQELRADSARLLVFLDQSATRADKDASNAAAAQLSVTARREGDRWVITGMAPR